MWIEYVGLGLLGFIALLLLGITGAVSDIQKELKHINRNIEQANNENFDHRKNVSDSVENLINENLPEFKEIATNLNDIKYVMDVIYKYKLPSKEDREFIEKNGL